MPANVPVVAVKVTPEGKVPFSERLGAGAPDAVTVNVLAEPTTNVALLRLVIAEVWFTVRVKGCVASVPMPLCAVTVMICVPTELAEGAPARVAVPFPLLVNVRPAGKSPVKPRVGAGMPDATNVYVTATPTTRVGLVVTGIVGAEGSGAGADPPPPPPQPARLSPMKANRRRKVKNRRPTVRGRLFFENSIPRQSAAVKDKRCRVMPMN